MSSDQHNPMFKKPVFKDAVFKDTEALLQGPHFHGDDKKPSSQQAEVRVEVPVFENRWFNPFGSATKFLYYLLALSCLVYFLLTTYLGLVTHKYRFIEPRFNLALFALAGLLLIYASTTFFLNLSRTSKVKANLKLYKNRITLFGLDGLKYRIPIDEVSSIVSYPIFWGIKMSWVKVTDCYHEIFLFPVRRNQIFLQELANLTSRSFKEKKHLMVVIVVIIGVALLTSLALNTKFALYFVLGLLTVNVLVPVLLMSFRFFSKRRVISRGLELAFPIFIFGLILNWVSMQPLSVKDKQFNTDLKSLAVFSKMKNSSQLSENCSKLLINYPKLPKYYHSQIIKVCPQFNFKN